MLDRRQSHGNRLTFVGRVRPTEALELTLRYPEAEGRTRDALPEGIYEVGRDTLEPRDFSISRRQALVACGNGIVQLQDAHSPNGTFVAGCRAERPITLQARTEVVFAGNRAIYLI
jgi:pSer/pThr/pTyr-binding forkhead associated (FHA) protein